jgi:hypothetical protein
MIGCSETSVTIYHYTLRKIPKERRSQIEGCNTLNQEKFFFFFSKLVLRKDINISVYEMCGLLFSVA